MIPFWRLCNGEQFWPNSGAQGRWHAADRGVIVLEATPVAALCAALAFAEVPHPSALPATYCLHRIWIPTNAIRTAAVPRRWQMDPKATQAVGQAWLDAGESLVLSVPSGSGGHQYLLNSYHADVRACRLDGYWSYPFEPGTVDVEPILQSGAEWLAVFEPPVTRGEDRMQVTPTSA